MNMFTKHIITFLLGAILLSGGFGENLWSQNSANAQTSILDQYIKESDVPVKFDIFFDNPNRYFRNSAFEWMAAVNNDLSRLQAEGNKDQLYKLYTIQAQIYFDLGEYDKCVSEAEKLFNETSRLDTRNRRVVLDILDQGYAELRMYDKQLEVRTQIKKLGERVTLYDIYSNLGLYRQAMTDYVINNRGNVKEDDYLANAIYNNDLGTYLRKDGSVYTAIKNINTALNYMDLYLHSQRSDKYAADFEKAVTLKGVMQGNLGKCYILLKRYEDAIPLLESGLSASREIDKGKHSKNALEMMADLADCYLNLDQLSTAKEYLSSISMYANSDNMIEYSRLEAEFYLKSKAFDSAAYYFQKNARIKDSIYSKTRRKELVGLLVNFDLENQRHTIEQQRLDIENTKAEILRRDKKISYSIFALVVTLLSLGMVIYAYFKSMKNKRLIENQKRIIETSLAEKDSLLKEIHHRVKNNLQMVSSLLNMQTKNTRSKPAIEALEEGKSRVKAMALIHQNLYQNEDLSVIEMQGYIESLINSIQAIYKKGGHNININIDAEGSELDIDRAIPIGLILNELVSNSFKYAFPEKEDGMIYINISRNGKGGYFEYLDTGKGFPEDVEERRSKSMGINLVNRLVNQLRSELNIESNEDGVKFWFNFS